MRYGYWMPVFGGWLRNVEDDVNALFNFVADAPRVVGFDPFVKLADYLEEAATKIS